MLIEDVINIFESALYEISQEGGLMATQLSSSDFQEILSFLRAVQNEAQSNGVPMGIQTLNASLNILRTTSAQDYLFGKSSDIRASDAASRNRGDVEARASNWAGPNRDRKLSDERSSQVEIVARVLDELDYITVDENNQTIRVNNRDEIARIRNFLQIAKDKAGANGLEQTISNFPKIVQVYQNVSKQKFSGKDEPFEGHGTAKMLTPNVLIFLARVSRNYSRKQRWDDYLNPANFEEGDGQNTGFFNYDPHEAANSLVKMGLAVKGDNGYRLNKEEIEKTVKNFRQVIASKASGAKIEAPTNKSGGLGQGESKAKELIEFMKSSFSNDVWTNAQKHVFNRLRKAGGDYEKALEWYLGARDNATGEDNPSPTVSAGLEKVNKTFLGSAIQFITAKFLARRMSYDAARILGDRKKKPDDFITSRDIAPIARAYSVGYHKRRSRI